MQTGTVPQGHYSPMVVPYVVAANLTASPGQVSTLAGFPFGPPAQSPQVHGSPQPQGPSGLFKTAHFCASGTPTGSAPRGAEPIQRSHGVLGWPG